MVLVKKMANSVTKKDLATLSDMVNSVRIMHPKMECSLDKIMREQENFV